MGDVKSNTSRMSRTERNDKLFKVIILGNTGVGKSSFIFRYVHGVFTAGLKATIGVDFALKKIEKSANQTIRLQIWDIAGHEQFSQVTKVYYRDASACIIMFDVSKPAAFLDVDKWKNDMDDTVRLKSGQPVPCMLLGNKTDLQRCVRDEEIKSYCRQRDFIGWATLSVKDNTNVEPPLRLLVETLLANESHSEYDLDIFTASDGNIRLPPELDNGKQSHCQC